MIEDSVAGHASGHEAAGCGCFPIMATYSDRDGRDLGRRHPVRRHARTGRAGADPLIILIR